MIAIDSLHTTAEQLLEVNMDRLWSELNISSAIGPGIAGGLRRLALSEADGRMRDHFTHSCKLAGCSVVIDRAGNIFARRAGTEDSLPAILLGSHLDTQVAGGRFDGVLGVLAALEVIQTLNDHGVETRRPIEIVNWTNEEGVRFQPPMMGSGVFCGVHTAEAVLAQQDGEGRRFSDDLTTIGFAGTVERRPSEFDTYFELHIEQGPILEAEGVDVGIVTGGFTSYGTEVKIRGVNAHSGPTPMADRHNALVGAAHIIAGLESLGWKHAPEGRAGCCRIDVSPNCYGILPHEAALVLDLRHPDADMAATMQVEALELVERTRDTANVQIDIGRTWSFGDIECDSELIALLGSVAETLGVSHRQIESAAGHDAYHLSSVLPSAMIFTPCRDGVTHNEKEYVERGYTAAGVNVLLHAVLQRANR